MKKPKKEPTKQQEKFKRRTRLKEQRKHKPKKSIRRNGKIVPISKKCIICGKNTKFHHFKCPSCGEERQC